MKQQRLEIVHNIPSPYRLHLFSALECELQKRNTDMLVHFFSHGHDDRPDSWRNPAIMFPHHFWRNYGFRWNGLDAHFNPALVGHLLAKVPNFLLVGGIWDTPTSLLVSNFARREKGIAWLEGNARTPGRIHGLWGAYKRAVLGRYDFIAVPGVEGARYIGLLRGQQPVLNSCVVILPNLVDETRFQPRWAVSTDARTRVRSSLGVNPNERLAVCSARLELSKGMLEFLSVVDPEMLTHWKLVIVGDGSQRAAIENLLRKRGLEAHVLLKGNVPYEEMPRLYAAADLFLLASLYDPNPLSVVEAMHSGLPLLLSNRVGNFPEALADKENGWGFDPGAPNLMHAAASSAFGAPAEQLAEMGRKSKSRALSFWNTDTAIRNFVDGIGIPS